jgi:hypothetical protein
LRRAMKKRILHVEDDGDTMLLVKTLLEKQGIVFLMLLMGGNVWICLRRGA